MVLGYVLVGIFSVFLVYWFYSSIRSIVTSVKKRRSDRRSEGESDGEK